MTRFFRRSGTTSSERMPGTTLTYRWSCSTSSTRIDSPDGDGRADQTLADLDAQRPPHLLRIADGVRQPEVFTFFVEQINGEGLERRQARDELRDLLEQLVQVEDGRDLAAKLEESQQETRRFPELWLGRRPVRRS